MIATLKSVARLVVYFEGPEISLRAEHVAKRSGVIVGILGAYCSYSCQPRAINSTCSMQTAARYQLVTCLSPLYKSNTTDQDTMCTSLLWNYEATQ